MPSPRITSLIASLDSVVESDTFDDTLKRYTGKRLPGGKGDRKHPSEFPREALQKGMRVEMEHTSDPDIALEVTVDHLSERPDYYEKLKKAGLADELKTESVIKAITAYLNEVFQPHPVDKEETTYHRATYRWKAGGHQYEAVFHPRDNVAGTHHVDVSFGTKTDGINTDYGAHDLGVDPTDTLATVHHATKDYMKNTVAKHHPDINQVVIHCRPTPSRKDTWTIKDGPDTQRGHSYAKLMHRAIRHDPEMAGVEGRTNGEGSKMHLILSFPQELGSHFKAQDAAPKKTWRDFFRRK